MPSKVWILLPPACKCDTILGRYLPTILRVIVHTDVKVVQRKFMRETYLCQLSLLLVRMTLRATPLEILNKSKLRCAGYYMYTLRAFFRFLIASLQATLNHDLHNFLCLVVDLGIVALAILNNIRVKIDIGLSWDWNTFILISFKHNSLKSFHSARLRFYLGTLSGAAPPHRNTMGK